MKIKAWIAEKRSAMSLRQKDAISGYLFVSPWILGAILFLILPLGQSFYYSLCDVKVSPKGRKFILKGIQNYTEIFRVDVFFVEDMINYLLSILLSVPVIVAFALIVSMLLDKDFKGKGFFRAIYFLPVIIVSGPVMGQLAAQGATTIPAINMSGITQILEQALPRFLAAPVVNLFNNMILILWYSGVQILIFLAALQKIDNSLYEAAKMDGASGWESFWKITLPILRPMLLLNAIYTVIYVSSNEQNVIITSIYNDMFAINRGFGFASAKAWLYSMIVLAIILIWMLILRDRDTYKAEVRKERRRIAKREKEKRKLRRRQRRRKFSIKKGV